ncbi:hypothetical protein NF867_06425 [Solitalea sp. MAHUQ-68]|uniref:Bestrophin n=1 Tax=Solitalea agri TaxID=2953739 RepID=A0A9X2F1Q1_9SPHI|nr:bestrophin family ion channel [Solitalea agri]MCO4292489.1 hypothetical protein [Solitalea agri]
MLLKQNLSLYRILKLTWKVDLGMLLLCAVVCYIDINFFPKSQIPFHLPALLGTALAFFVAFNNNQAYDRWWEARIIWGGLVNDSRSWTRALLHYTNDRACARKMIFRHIGFLYALKASLRKVEDFSYRKYLSQEEIEIVDRFSNTPNAIMDLQAKDLQYLATEEPRIDGFRFLALNNLLTNFCDGMGKSERIKNTVFPTTYVYFTRLFIWILVTLITLTSSNAIGYAAIIIGWLIGFVFHATHINGMTIMNPFDLDPSCIPLNSIVRTIEINLLEALEKTDIPAPEKTIREGEYIL